MMVSPTLIDASTRTKPMAKKKWIKSAVSKNPGAFSAKAKAAGESTRDYAAEKAGAPGKLGKEARLASTLIGMHHKGTHKLYSQKD